jgi:endonuclease/exonuclease/phosphatase family metal-dependent hydrolase
MRRGANRERLRPLRVLATLLLVASVTALVIGSIATDRWHWSQWIWWIPRGALALAALPALLVALIALGTRRTRWSVITLLCALIPVLWFAVADIGWRRWQPKPQRFDGAIHIIHWNASSPGSRAGAPASESLLARDADIVIVTNAYKLLGDGRIELWRDAGYEIVPTGPFLVASRWPILEARVISAVERRLLGRARISVAGREWTILAVDLPSDARLSRSDLAERFRAESAQHDADGADLIVGDFNITRGSASIRSMFPGFRHAFDEAGIGFGATWPRRLPFMHIDHMLLGSPVECHGYRIIDVAERPHLAQEAIIAPRAQ